MLAHTTVTTQGSRAAVDDATPQRQSSQADEERSKKLMIRSTTLTEMRRSTIFSPRYVTILEKYSKFLGLQLQPRTKVRVAAVQAPGYYIPVLSAANFPATAMIFLHAQCSKKSLSGIKLLVLFLFVSRLFSATFTGTTFLGFLPSLARWKQRFERKPGDQECKSVSGHEDQRRGSCSNRARTQRSKTRHLPRAAPKPSSLSLDRRFPFSLPTPLRPTALPPY
ncbi:unnamed protein product [Sphagnum balticum]